MTVDVKDWDMNKVDDGVIKIVGEVQLRKYGKFLEEYSTQLRAIEHALDETLSDVWNSELDPVSLQLLPYERTTVLELISTDNKVLNKVVSVLAVLCCEIDQLCYEAKSKFFPALLFYGEGESPGALQDGEAHIYLGRMIPFMQTVYKHLGFLLTTLMTLDEIIDGQVTLREHWTQYKRMLVSIHHNPSKLGLSIEKLRPFEKVISKLENQLLEGSIFMGCVEQNFDDSKNFVSKNSYFAEEFALNIKNQLIVNEPRLGESNEYDSRLRIPDICCLFVLHFYLYRTVDKKFFKALWDTYKKVPAVPLIGNILWFPDLFLLTRVPAMARTFDRKAQEAVKFARQTYLQQRTQNIVK
ncbi:WASH complex subunit 4-like [Uloborus diversus]|uniref:WASH complex subunit 4-like n=1 Tax=Uloborus diversus TaxID=327109 RepID=UPI002409A792|nr:WASH complex subunit 4-like [Uloborus diversus]